MTCQEFLETHSEYVDGVLTPVDAARFKAHASECASCARYDRVVRRGAALLGALPPIEPSADLLRNVHKRTAAIEREPRQDGLTWAVSVAAVLAIIAWSPLLRNLFESESVPPSAAVRGSYAGAVADLLPDPTHAEVRFGYEPAPWVWHGAPRADVQTVEVLASGPYSPLTVDPPAYHAAPPPARAVWMALHPDD